MTTTDPRDWWSARRFVRLAVTILVLIHLSSAVVMVFDGGWRRHLTFGTDRTTVEVVDVDRDAISCGRRTSGDRLHITWTDGDGDEQEGTAQCVGYDEVGDTFTAWPVPDDRAYDWPTWEFYVFTALGALALGAGFTLLVGWLRRRGERTGANAPSAGSPSPGGS